MIFSNATIGSYLCTIAAPIYHAGSSFYSGTPVSLTLLPAEPDSGIRFLRKDIEAKDNWIRASWRNLVEDGSLTTIGNASGIIVRGVDLVLAALRGCGVDNVVIEIDGPEMPLFDGSSAPLAGLINRIGLVPQRLSRPGYWIEQPMQVRLGESYAILNPSSLPRMTVNVEFRHAAMEAQCISLEMVDHVFTRELAPARGFGPDPAIDIFSSGDRLHRQFQSIISRRNRADPAGLRLRYRDEFARHAMLKCIGDLALAGGSIFGHLFVHQPNHRLNHMLLRELFANRQSWSRLGYNEIRRRVLQAHGEQSIKAKVASIRPH